MSGRFSHNVYLGGGVSPLIASQGASMVRVRFRRWAFDANPAETSQIYAIRAQRGAPCPCPWCRNFCSVREREEVFPEEIRLLFGELGIDYRGEVELLSPGPRAT